MDLYTVYVVCVMLAAPIVSMFIECIISKGGGPRDWVGLIGKWFIFWAIGCRCLTAGISQSINPAFTAAMLQVDTGAFVIIRELGFANIAIGTVGIVSLFAPRWRPAAAAAGGIFLGAAGMLHILRIGEGIYLDELIAMIGDLWVLVIAAVFLIHSLKEKQVQRS